MCLGYPKDKIGSSTRAQVYHYGSEDNFKLRKRRYSYEQVVSYNQFVIMEGDSCTNNKYPTHISWREKILKKYSLYSKNAS